VPEDFAIDRVEGSHWYESVIRKPVLVIYPKIPGYVAKI